MNALGVAVLLTVYSWMFAVAWQRGWVQQFCSTILGRFVSLWRGVDPPPEKAGFGALHTYYGGHEITRAVEDIWSPIEAVIAAVEHQISREAAASKSYKADPSLIYEGHPWMTFVRSGGAEYLGWAKDHVPGPTPVEQRRRQEYGYVLGERGREAMVARPIRIGEDKPTVDLMEYLSKSLLTSDEAVALIHGCRERSHG